MSCNSFKENVLLPSSFSFKNGNFGGNDLFYWMSGEKQRGIDLLVAVVGNFLSTPASTVFCGTS